MVIKTPDEIKKGLEPCGDKSDCVRCEFAQQCDIEADALAYIQQLEKEIELERSAKKGTLVFTSSGDITWEIERMPGWISVEERLPEATMPPHDVLVYHNVGGSICIDRAWYSYDTHKWRSYLGNNLKVTHWMPLPEPPTEV